MKFKSDIEVEAGIKDSSGAIGTAGQVLSSTGSNVSWVTNSMVAERVQHRVKAGVAINKGQAVYVTGADGTNIIVGKASNASEATSSKTLGLIDATVAVNGFANVVEIGGLAGLNTIGSTVGDPVWLGTDGNLIYGLANKPYAPQHLVFIGVVTRVNSNNGEIFINVQNGFELNEIHDVDIKTDVPINGDILGYNGTLWVNKTIAEWLGYVPADDALVVHKAGTETITGSKTFANSTTGAGIIASNTSTGIGISALNFSTGYGIYSSNMSTGYGIVSTNNSTGVGINAENSSGGAGIRLSNSGTGNGLNSINTMSGNGIVSSNSSTGTGIFSSNTSTGNGIVSYNNSGGTAIYLVNYSTGRNLVLNNTTASTGLPFVVQKNGVDKLTINDAGEVTGTKFNSGGTANQFVKGDGTLGTITIGTVTSVAALTLGTTGTDLSSTVANPTTTPVITLNVPTASATNRGALSAADWTSFNSKVSKYAQTINVSGSAYTNICTITGDSLASAIKISFQGTSSGVVVNTTAEILVNHYQDISITSNSGFYAQLNIRVVSNNNEAYSIEAQVINAAQATGLNIEVFPLNSESVTFQGTLVTAGTTLVHTTRPGIYITSSDNNAAAITSGGNIYAQDSVGIGTFTPNQKLQVAGNISVGTTLPLLISNDTSETNFVNNIYYPTDNTGYGFAIGKNVAGIKTKQFVVRDTGNVGVGTATPGVKFVNSGGGNTDGPTFGSGTVGSDAILSGNGLYGLYTGVSNAGHVWQQVQRNDASTAVYPLVLQPSGGSLGVGTNSPLAKMTVRGGNLGNTISMASTIFSSQANDQGIFIGAFNGTPSYGSWIQAGREAFDLQFNLSLQPSGGNVLIGKTADDGYKLQVTGGINTSGNSVIAGTFSFINLENNASKLQVSRFLAIQDNASNVGIGYNQDSVPFGDKFSVNGNSYFNGVLKNTANATFGLGANRPVTYDSNGGNFRIKANDGGWAMGYFFDGSTGTYRGGFGAYGSANDLGYYWIGNDFNIPTMVVTPNQGGVGIGTTEPVNKLHIQNGTTANTVAMIQSWGTEAEGEHAGIRFKSAVVAANEYGKGFIAYRNAGIGYGRGDFWFCLNNDTNSLNATLSDPKMVIKSGGFVGIGTVNPARKLDIVGGHTTATFRLHYPVSEVPGQDASVDMWASEPGVSYNGSGIGSNVNGHPYYGRTNPALGQGFIRFIDGTTAFHNSSTNAVYAERMRIMPGGNVLIGTTTDTGYKLEVNGNVKATGFFNSSDNRLKDLVDYEYDVSSIKPITYFWKDLRDNKKHIGYSAQEVQKVMPDAVNEGEDGYLSVNYIEVLVAKIAELENRIKQLEK